MECSTRPTAMRYSYCPLFRSVHLPDQILWEPLSTWDDRPSTGRAPGDAHLQFRAGCANCGSDNLPGWTNCGSLNQSSHPSFLPERCVSFMFETNPAFVGPHRVPFLHGKPASIARADGCMNAFHDHDANVDPRSCNRLAPPALGRARARCGAKHDTESRP